MSTPLPVSSASNCAITRNRCHGALFDFTFHVEATLQFRETIA